MKEVFALKEDLIRSIEDAGTEYLRDESRSTGFADYAAFPKTADETAAALEFARENDLAVTIQGGRTGVAAAAVPYGGLIINMSKMDHITGMSVRDGRYVIHAEPGVTLRELRRQISARDTDVSGWTDDSLDTFRMFSADKEQFFPTDPTETSATVGGMAACNASGARSYLYKAMRKHVEGLRMILADGRFVTIHRGDVIAAGLRASLPCEDGSTVDFDVPSFRMPDVKNASGYFAAPDMDILDLLVGSDGTLGAIVELYLLLDPLPANIWGCACLFNDEQEALDFVVSAKTVDNVAAIEYFDEGALRILREQKKEGGVFDALREIPEHTKSIVYTEVHCESEDDAMAALVTLGELAVEAGGSEEDTWVAETRSELEGLMFFRHAVPESVNMRIDALRKKDANITKMGSDMSVPDDKLFEAVAMYRRGIKDIQVDSAIWGHIGDNHLHVNLLPQSREDAEKVRNMFLGWAKEITGMGGAVSAEHGVGKLKASFLEIMYGPEHIEEMRAVKRAFDPEWRLGRNNMFTP